MHTTIRLILLLLAATPPVQVTPYREHGRSVSTTFLVRAPREQAFAVLADTAAMPEYMPLIEKVETVRRFSGGEIVRFEARAVGFITTDYVLERHYRPPQRITWTKVEGPGGDATGSWTLTATTGGTLLTYRNAVDVGPLVPDRVKEYLLTRGLPDLIEAVTRRIESGGTWRKER